MNYEKAYKEALERAREFQKSKDGLCVLTAESIFPELRDSKDERIRKALVRFHKSTIDVDGIKGEDIIAWLEKQGKRDVRYENLEELLEADTIYQMAMNDAMVEGAKTKAMNALSELEIGKLLGIEKQGEQKPTWSEGDETLLYEIVDYFNMDDALRHTENEIIDWLKSLKERLSKSMSHNFIVKNPIRKKILRKCGRTKC